MTLTLIARNPYTRQLGMVMASGSDDCVGGSLVEEGLAALGRPALLVVQGKGDRDLRRRLGAGYLQGQKITQLMQDLAEKDSALPLRQVLMASFDQPLQVATGQFCGPWAGHIAEEHLIAAGNVLTSSVVLQRMRKGYMQDLNAPMRFRLLAALRAALSAGGDRRGHASAGLIIAGEQPYRMVVTGSRQPLDDLLAGVA
jgi:uncharacterized Ntn-hydrolase superfamily protein